MPASQTISLSLPESDIAMLTFDMPDKGANVLSASVLDELAGHLDALEKRTGLAGLIVRSGKPGTFIAGADLREFAAGLQNIDSARVVDVCRPGVDDSLALSIDVPLDLRRGKRLEHTRAKFNG